MADCRSLSLGVYAERGDYSRSVKLNISGASESFVACLLADLLHLIGGGIVGSMPSNRTQQQTADLFRASDQSTTTEESPERRQPQEPNVALTRGQVNAVRAAFKAGITPSRIARQFGISQSDVRKVLASESRRAGKGR